jgi:superfamily I DNA/RNA helicase
MQNYKPRIKREAASRMRQTLAAAKAVPGNSPKDTFISLSSADTYEWAGNFYYDYRTTLETSGALDFEDLLRTCLKVFEAVPWAPGLANLRHVLVDELYVISIDYFGCCRPKLSATAKTLVHFSIS